MRVDGEGLPPGRRHRKLQVVILHLPSLRAKTTMGACCKSCRTCYHLPAGGIGPHRELIKLA